jgi:hypothetical protein
VELVLDHKKIMNQAKTYFLLKAVILSVMVSCKKDEPASNLSAQSLQVHAGHDTIVNLPATAITLYGIVITAQRTNSSGDRFQVDSAGSKAMSGYC